MSTRTMRPRRASVSSAGALCVLGFRGLTWERGMQELSMNAAESTTTPHTLSRRARLGGCDAQAHVYRGRGVSKGTDGNEVHTGFGIGANIFQINPARALQRNAPFRLRTALDGRSDVRNRHVVEQNGFAAIGERFFQFRQTPDFHFNRLGAAPVAMRPFESSF